MALTADFPSITIVGNAANQVFPDQEYLDEVYEVKNGYTKLFYDYYGTEVGPVSTNSFFLGFARVKGDQVCAWIHL